MTLTKNNLAIFSKEFGAQTYLDILKCIKNCDPDLIVISTSTNLHNYVLEQILIANRKNITILCEKPISNNSKKTRELINKLEINNNNIFVNYMRRSDPISTRIKEIIQQENNFNSFVGTCYYGRYFFNNASHIINLLNFGLAKSIRVRS